MWFEFVASLLSKTKEKVSQIYYKHGLNCCTNPFLVILCSLIVVSLCCYPLLGIHIFQTNHPQQYATRLEDETSRSYYQVPSSSSYGASSSHSSSFSSSPSSKTSSSSGEFSDHSNADHHKLAPRWFQNVPPFAYVQQVVIKSAVIPWKNNLILMDAIRAPLAEVFPIVQFISNYHLEKRDSSTPLSLNDICFQVSEPLLIKDNVASSYLPHFSCLIVSPATVWKNDLNKFLQDATIINTLYSIKHVGSPDSVNFREILFGEPWMETGIKKLFVRTRQRTISYVITLVFSKYDAKFVDSLKQALRQRYPLDPFKPSNETFVHPDIEKAVQDTQNKVVHLYFQDQFSFRDYVPLVTAYVMLFLYIYFSVRKIDLIKVKWALALGSCLSVMLSLLMTVGICLWLDINPRLSGNDISPYLVVIIGLENILVLTKSIVSTPPHLDIKVRVAQGLSREGPTFTKNLLLEVGLLLFGYFTFVPEFCLFGMIGFLSDFFLQLTFFAAILSVDIQKVEPYYCKGKLIPKAQQTKTSYNTSIVDGYMASNSQASTTNIFARPSRPKNFKLPKRLRFVYFWASNRIFHRLFMMCLLLWINFFVLKTGFVDQISSTERMMYTTQKRFHESGSTPHRNLYNNIENLTSSAKNDHVLETSLNRLKHYASKHTSLLSAEQWSTLFGYYNLSLSGRYISVLPSVHLSIPVDPATAIRLRHPSESDPQILRQFLTATGSHNGPSDPNDDLDDYSFFVDDKYQNNFWTPAEIILAIILSLPTLIFLIYVFVTLYRCMCSRNYAEWRSSWSDALKLSSWTKKDGIEVVLTETLPVKLHGHEQEIELIASSEDTPYVATICMAGSLRVWDVLSGECHTLIKRASLRPHAVEPKLFKPHHKQSGSFSSDSTYGSSPGTGSFEFQFDSPIGKVADHKQRMSLGNVDSSLRTSHSPEGFDFSPYCSKHTTSKNVIKELFYNAATNTAKDTLHEIPANVATESPIQYHSPWCVDIFDRYTFIGCESGHFEVWDSLSGDLAYHSEGSDSGVTVIRATMSKVVLGFLDGSMEIYSLEGLNGYVSKVDSYSFHTNDITALNYRLVQSVRAHRQPITVLQVEASHIITGSADHLLKVFRLDTGACIYTLHGHCGGITCIEFDKSVETSAFSGCQVGQICVWDLSTGTCVFSLEAHQSSGILSLLATPLYFLSCALDNKICIWDKYSGQLVHTISQHHTICKDMVLLAPNILVTAREDHIILWDISEGSPLRLINLGDVGSKQAYIKNLRLSSKSRAIVCDFGQQFCVVHFPGITQKRD